MAKDKIGNCFLSFQGSNGLTAEPADRLPKDSEKSRKLKTNNGEVTITRIDGYRVLYNNDKKAPFVNLKVELSDNKSYAADTTSLIENLKYLNGVSQGMESKDILELTFNGCNVYGLSRSSIEKGSTLGTFIMFPGNDITVFFYFNNMKPEYRHFESVDDYKKLRDKFMDDYTKHLKSCDNK
ncbi:MAG TPA: hypothetical protein VI731_08595 [Bacteroidia bacterium]|nr:hypothetical protein [Bacteroidia bacterium]